MSSGFAPERDLVPDWMKQVNPGELPEVYQEMSEIIGLEYTMQLAQVFAGNSVYFPKLERSLLCVRNQMIRREFNGANVRALARRWGLSSRHVRHIVSPRRAGLA
ncbi:MAG: Mor transcription activator family protein [Thermodesulfobacteriota bacterium]